MEKISLVSVSPETRKTIKQQVIRLHRKGIKGKEIADTLNLSEFAVSRIVSAFKKEGMKCVNEKTRGRKLGDKRSLSPEQEKEVFKTIIDKYPEQMKLSFALWTRAAIQQLIRDKYGIDVPLRTISNYLERWGMTCQRPTKKAYSQDNVKLKKFMCYEDSMTQQRFIEFMTRLVHDSDRKVLFIVDNLRVHHGKKVQEWLDKHTDEIEIFYTSPYSPEINPDEYLNHTLKQSVH